MPKNISTVIIDDVATVTFLDHSLRDAGLRALLAAAEPNPHVVRKVTRPRLAYVVPAEVARAAGLVDVAVEDQPAAQTGDADGAGDPDTATDPGATDPDAQATAGDPPADPQTTPDDPDAKPSESTKGYDDGEPDMDWSREALNAAAANAGVAEPEKLPNKPAVLKAYRDAKAKAAKSAG